jgi:hypothetical protein
MQFDEIIVILRKSGWCGKRKEKIRFSIKYALRVPEGDHPRGDGSTTFRQDTRVFFLNMSTIRERRRSRATRWEQKSDDDSVRSESVVSRTDVSHPKRTIQATGTL